MAKAHERILAIAITCDEGDDTVLGTAITYYRDRGHLDDSDGKTVKMTAGSAAANHEIELGEVIVPPSIIRIESTFQA